MVIRFVSPLGDVEQRTRQQRGDELFIKIFFTPEGTANPSPLYRNLQDEVPVHVSGFGGALLTRYDDCRQLLRDNRFGAGDGMPDGSFGGADTPELALRRERQAKRIAEGSLSMLALDPPSHTRQRSLVSRAFTPRMIERLKPRIVDLTDRCLDDLAAAGTGDVMELLAKPLPVSVISDMLGVPDADWPEIRGRVSELVAVLEPNATLEQLQLAEAANDVLFDYFRALVATRRSDPRDDLISGLIAAADGDDRLTENEILAVSVLLFAAGAETTTNLIGNAVHQLLSHPDALNRLWADPSLVPSMVEEVLRHDSPVQLDARVCLEPATFAGLDFDEGDRVITLLGAANHDPAHFSNPDAFDITRFAATDRGNSPEPVMSFGSGIHYCLGASLARAEGQIVFERLLQRFDPIEPAGDRVYRNSLVLRGLLSCPIRVSSSR